MRWGIATAPLPSSSSPDATARATPIPDPSARRSGSSSDTSESASESPTGDPGPVVTCPDATLLDPDPALPDEVPEGATSVRLCDGGADKVTPPVDALTTDVASVVSAVNDQRLVDAGLRRPADPGVQPGVRLSRRHHLHRRRPVHCVRGAPRRQCAKGEGRAAAAGVRRAHRSRNGRRPRRRTRSIRRRSTAHSRASCGPGRSPTRPGWRSRRSASATPSTRAGPVWCRSRPMTWRR